MKKHLTDAAIQRLKPPREGQQTVFDLGYPGLSLRIGHGGAKCFEIYYRHGGKLRRDTIGRWPAITLADARETWRKTREAIAKGHGPTIEGRAQCFEFVVEEWLKRDQAKNAAHTIYTTTRTIEADLLPAWRGKRVDAITKRDVIALLDSVADRGAPIMAVRVRRLVRRFFRWCIERDIIKSDPTDGLPKADNGKSRDRVLTDAEIAKVWGGVPAGPHGHAMRLLILTGARREEITKLRWSDIEGDCINLPTTKTGAPHIIPLSAAAQQLIASPRVDGCAYVFTLNGCKHITGWTRAKRQIDQASGVAGWVIHDLRRTVATGMQKLGVTLQTVEAVLGHTSGSRGGIVGVYQVHDLRGRKAGCTRCVGPSRH